MNWTGELLDLYEKNADEAGIIEKRSQKGPLVLLPVFHTTVAAQVTVTLDGAGNFVQAEIVPEEEKLTIIPVTDKSSSRTASMAPHPLCDTIRYLAGDYMEFYSGKKEKDFRQYYEEYIDNLAKWRDSPYTHDKVNAVYHYLCNEKLVKDLVDSSILMLNEGGKLEDTVKIQKISQTEIMIRFRILPQMLPSEDVLLNVDGKYHPECWLDQSLQKSFIDYTKSTWKEKGLSYLTGEMAALTYLHPKKIRNEGDGTKLFSANDKENFTFRGRFESKEEAFAISYEESQKIHNALKWIIRKQGFYSGALTIVVWDSDLLPLPEWYEDTEEAFEKYEEEDFGEYEEETVSYIGTNELAAKRFNRSLKGYGRPEGMSRTVLLALDAATPGRVSLVEYKTFRTARYIENLGYWHGSGSWQHRKFRDKNLVIYQGVPSIYEIARLLYGTEQEDMLTLSGKEKVFAGLCKRLLPCITDRKKLPADLLRLAINRASSPQSFHNPYNWEAVVTLACSFIKKQRLEEKKEEWTLEIKEECMERDYLYGRLLAVADWVEYISMGKEDKRETNAKRYMSAFSKRPFTTWQIIEEKLPPYLKKLNSGSQYFYQTLLDDIQQKFSVEDFRNNKELNGLYLLGYHQQSYLLKNSKKKEEKEDEQFEREN